jgi:potassium uptake TrkH family protein
MALVLQRVAEVMTQRPRRGRGLLRHPSQVVAAVFLAGLIFGTLVLMLPLSTTDGRGAPPLTALFHATSALCVTGLATEDYSTYWTPFGHFAILAMIQIGGLGIMSLASLLGLAVSRHLGLRARMFATEESNTVNTGDVRRVLLGVVALSLSFESLLTLILTARWYFGYDESLTTSAYYGISHAVMAFNNAGFAVFSDGLMGFVSDPWICLPVAAGVISGGLGFPVWFELLRLRRGRRHRSLHTRLTVGMTLALLVGGTAFVTLVEWNNPATLGTFPSGTRLLAGFFQAVMPRTAGFNSVDIGQLHEGTLLGMLILMFIGGGSASTAGGIKVTTFVLLLFVIIAEVRGEERVTAINRTISQRLQRQALTIALLSVAAVMGGTLLLIAFDDFTLIQSSFEVTSAFATAGMSTGITPHLSGPGQFLLVVLMFLGRLGPITLVSAMALRSRPRLYDYPEGRPIIG